MNNYASIAFLFSVIEKKTPYLSQNKGFSTVFGAIVVGIVCAVFEVIVADSGFVYVIIVYDIFICL